MSLYHIILEEHTTWKWDKWYYMSKIILENTRWFFYYFCDIIFNGIIFRYNSIIQIISQLDFIIRFNNKFKMWIVQLTQEFFCFIQWTMIATDVGVFEIEISTLYSRWTILLLILDIPVSESDDNLLFISLFLYNNYAILSYCDLFLYEFWITLLVTKINNI